MSRIAKKGGSKDDKNHLQTILKKTELSAISKAITHKINVFIEEQFQKISKITADTTTLDATITDLNGKNEETSAKLTAANETLAEFEKQVEILNKDHESSRKQICLMENEVLTFKKSRDEAVDDKNELKRQLQQRITEIERLKVNEKSLLLELHVANNAKCDALSLIDEIQSKEQNLQLHEKKHEKENMLLKSQILTLTEEVNRLTYELRNVGANLRNDYFLLEKQLSEKSQSLNIANETINQLNDTIKRLKVEVEKLTERLDEQHTTDNEVVDNYKKELDAKTRISDLYNTMCDDANLKIKDLNENSAHLNKLLQEANKKTEELETQIKQMQIDHDVLINKNNEFIASMQKTSDDSNEHMKNVDNALVTLAPSATASSKFLKSVMSFTQIYSQLVKFSTELAQEKEENNYLKITISSIKDDLDEKKQSFQTLQEQFDNVVNKNIALNQQLEILNSEHNRLKEDHTESLKRADNYIKDNTCLKGELQFLGQQVCCLLKEIEKNHSGSDTSRKILDDTNFEDTLPNTLVTFNNIEELQCKNLNLLQVIKKLTEKLKELKSYKEKVGNEDSSNKLSLLNNKVSQLTDLQTRQSKMINGLIRQRDMFKRLYNDHIEEKRHEVSAIIDSGNNIFQITDIKSLSSACEKIRNLDLKFNETLKQLESLKDEYTSYKEEKSNNENLLFEQIDNMRTEIAKLTAANSKYVTTLNFNRQRLKNLQAHIDDYRKQITSLEEKIKVYNITISKLEVSVQHFRDTALEAQSKLASAEVTIENFKLDRILCKDTKLRLQCENEILNRERNSEELVLNNVELFKASLQRVEIESHINMESMLEAATRECTTLKKQLQEEQNRHKDLISHLETQTETLKCRLQEEKDAADVMRAEISQLRDDVLNKNKYNEGLTKKLNMTLTSNISDRTMEFITKIKELEKNLIEKNTEIKSLQDKIEESKGTINEYCEKLESSERENLKIVKEYNSYKIECVEKLRQCTQKIQNLQEQCTEMESDMALKGNGERTDKMRELIVSNNQLKECLGNYEICKNELNVSQSKVEKLLEAVHVSEKKYADEMLLHSDDMKTLTRVKDEFTNVKKELKQLNVRKENEIKKIESEKLIIIERGKFLENENKQLLAQLEDLNKQNSLLYEQVATLSAQMSNASKSLTESLNESGNESSINISLNEADTKSSEQLLQIIKFLRKEKDIAFAKCEIVTAEVVRIKSLLQVTQKKLKDSELALCSEKEKLDGSSISVTNQSELLRKVDTFNALVDSNRVLREQRDSLVTQVDILTTSTKTLEEELLPLRGKVAELSLKVDTLQSDNSSLKADTVRWRTRVNALVEKANKTNPEDWKRLQNERETLAKMLTTEKENVKKLSGELGIIKIEKSKLENQYSVLLQNHTVLSDDHKKVMEEMQVLKDDMCRVTEEVVKLKKDTLSTSALNSKLETELKNMEITLADVRNKEMQIRKIARKYKTMYEELVKEMEGEKKKREGEEATVTASNAEANKKTEESITNFKILVKTEKSNNDKLKAEIESLRNANLEKDDKAKQVLKQAKSRIVQLTETKNALSKELEEALKKIGANDQSTCEEQNIRLALLKSQYENKLSHLEKEKSELQSEIESLQQKVNLLQRQSINQLAAFKLPPNAEKTSSDPPTANIKPLAGVVQAIVSGGRRTGDTPLASIRPVAQVGPTAPHDAPSCSSRLRTSIPVSNTSPESTQDMDTRDNVSRITPQSEITEQPSSQSQALQQVVALVLPRVEQSSSTYGSGSNSEASTSSGVSDNASRGLDGAGGITSSSSITASEAADEAAVQSGVSTTLKRPRLSQTSTPGPKKAKLQSQNLGDVHDMEGSPQSRSVGDTSSNDEVEPSSNIAGSSQHEGPEAESCSQPHSLMEVIDSGSEGREVDDNSTVPSTSNLHIEKKIDSSEESMPTSVVSSGDGADSHQETQADLVSAEPQVAHSDAGSTNEGESGQDSMADISSQGSETVTPSYVAEEGREAEASVTPPTPSRRPFRGAPHNAHAQRWQSADEGGMQGRGMRPRGRGSRRPYGYQRY